MVNEYIFKLILKDNNYSDSFTECALNSVKFDVYLGTISKNQKFDISIIVPIYNNETLIHRTLMSIENQSFNFNNIEVLMVNDGSTDNTLEIINQYADKYSNFKAIHIKNSTGSAGTPRNLGLKLSSGDYVLFLDHDDFLEIDALEKLHEKIINFHCDFVYGTYVLVEDNNPIKFSYPNLKHGFFNSLEDNPESLITPPSIWTKLFRKDFLLENNILFPVILGEDAVFISKALKYANGIYYMGNEVICYYNLNEDSFTSNLSYEYFVEGFISEKYLFDLYCGWGHDEYYGLRGQGILEYYINRFMISNLSNDEIKQLFNLFHCFCNRLYQFNLEPKNERNKTVFYYILNNDLENLIKFKNYRPSKIKVIINKILNKINKREFW